MLWTVWEIILIGQDPQRYIGCDLMKRYSADDWGYKGMDESWGVGYFTCPVSFFDDVPCPDNDTAREWRAAVMEKARARQGVEVGSWVVIHGKPRYLKILEKAHAGVRIGGSYRATNGYANFRLRRGHVIGLAKDLNEMEAKLTAAFPGSNTRLSNGWRDHNPDREVGLRMIEFAKANPFPDQEKALVLHASQVIECTWLGVENNEIERLQKEVAA